MNDPVKLNEPRKTPCGAPLALLVGQAGDSVMLDERPDSAKSVGRQDGLTDVYEFANRGTPAKDFQGGSIG